MYSVEVEVIMAKVITMRIDESILEKFSEFAKIENRSLSNFIETATLKYINDIEYTDDFEIKDILNDKELVSKLKKGSKDAKNLRGRFVEV
ncbi:MAG TPA: CopG family transcriptional regulator [Spirochaetota bacterium]|nr:CopG family transcriptional regulator [Spirochaetota bacterium]